MTEADDQPGPISTRMYEAELQQQDVQGRYKSLRAAFVVLRVFAVLYAVLSIIPFVKGLLDMPVTPPDGYIVALVSAFVKEMLTVFFTWVFADVVRILLDTRVDTVSIRVKS